MADAHQRALVKAETLLAKVRNSPGDRYYKTCEQVDTRVARIVGPNIAGLLSVTTGADKAGKPTLAWAATRLSSPPPPAWTACTRWPPTLLTPLPAR